MLFKILDFIQKNAVESIIVAAIIILILFVLLIIKIVRNKRLKTELNALRKTAADWESIGRMGLSNGH